MSERALAENQPCPRCQSNHVVELPVKDPNTQHDWYSCVACSHLWTAPRSASPSASASDQGRTSESAWSAHTSVGYLVRQHHSDGRQPGLGRDHAPLPSHRFFPFFWPVAAASRAALRRDISIVCLRRLSFGVGFRTAPVRLAVYWLRVVGLAVTRASEDSLTKVHALVTDGHLRRRAFAGPQPSAEIQRLSPADAS